MKCIRAIYSRPNCYARIVTYYNSSSNGNIRNSASPDVEAVEENTVAKSADKNDEVVNTMETGNDEVDVVAEDTDEQLKSINNSDRFARPFSSSSDCSSTKNEAESVDSDEIKLGGNGSESNNCDVNGGVSTSNNGNSGGFMGDYRNKRIIIYSKTQIEKGEELTYDYKFDREFGEERIPCMCFAKGCRRYLN